MLDIIDSLLHFNSETKQTQKTGDLFMPVNMCGDSAEVIMRRQENNYLKAVQTV